MASPKMLAQREQQAHLVPRVFRLNRAARPKTMMRGDYIELLRQSARNANVRTHERVAASNASGRDGQPRAIPTGGAGRRRAKALRNKAAVEGTEQAAGRVPRAVPADALFGVAR